MTPDTSIIDILDNLVDPFLNLSGKEMGLSYTTDKTGNSIQVNIRTGFPNELFKQNYLPLASAALAHQFPNERIDITTEQFIRAHKTQLTGQALKGVKNTIAVASGKGGVGKSTVTVNLAAALAKQGARVGILDADIYGPSIPLMLGAVKPVALQGDFYLPVQAHNLQAMSMGYLAPTDQALIWRGPMIAKSLIQMLDITLWDELDYLFIDLPPGTGDIQLTLVQKIPLTTAIVVTTPQNVATLDAEKALTMFNKTGIDTLGLVENMSTHICSACGHQEAIFGTGGAHKLAQNHDSLLLGQLPLDGRIRAHSDEGSPTATRLDDKLAEAFIKTALRAAIELAQKPLNYASKFPKVVVE